MTNINILSGTFFQRELSGNQFLLTALVELDVPVIEKTFYAFDPLSLTVYPTAIIPSPSELSEYDSLTVGGMFKNFLFPSFSEFESLKGCLFIPIEDNIYFMLVTSKEGYFFDNNGHYHFDAKGDNVITFDIHGMNLKEVKTKGEGIDSICRMPIWSAGHLNNIYFSGFNTESIVKYRNCKLALVDFLRGNISKEKFEKINYNNNRFIIGHDDDDYIEYLRFLLEKNPSQLLNINLFTTPEEYKKEQGFSNRAIKETQSL